VKAGVLYYSLRAREGFGVEVGVASAPTVEDLLHQLPPFLVQISKATCSTIVRRDLGARTSTPTAKRVAVLSIPSVSHL
jgi:hypothetical protein